RCPTRRWTKWPSAPTTPTTAWRPGCGPGRCPAPTSWRPGCAPGRSTSTSGAWPTPRHRSAVTRPPAWGASTATPASTPTSRSRRSGRRWGRAQARSSFVDRLRDPAQRRGKLQQQLGHAVGGLDLRAVTYAGQQLELRVGQRGHDALGAGCAHHEVALAPDQQDRDGDALQRERVLQLGNQPAPGVEVAADRRAVAVVAGEQVHDLALDVPGPREGQDAVDPP